MLTGLGALAFGSGAVTVSGAFSGQTTNPSADLNVLADARLVVRAPDTIFTPPASYSGATDAVKKTTLDSVSDPEFDRGNLPLAQIDSDDTNDNYTMRTAVTTGTNVSFNGIMEIVNNDGTAHDVGINYGDYGGGGAGDGYGDDVDTSSHDNSNSSALDPKAVQEIYKFRVPDDSNYLPSAATQSAKFLSPDPGTTDDKYNETVKIGAGEAATLILDYDTTGKTGIINQAATGGNPFLSSTYVDLLDSLWVESDP